MATGHDSRRTMPTGGVGSPIGGRPLGTRLEDATGAWAVCPLHRASLGVDQASEGRTDGVQMSSLTTIQKYYVEYGKLQHCPTLHRGG